MPGLRDQGRISHKDSRFAKFSQFSTLPLTVFWLHLRSKKYILACHEYLSFDGFILQRLTTLVGRLETSLRGSDELHTILTESTAMYRAVPALLS